MWVENMKKIIITLCIILGFMACDNKIINNNEQQNDLFEGDNPFIGTWENKIYNEFWIFNENEFVKYEKKQQPAIFWDHYYGIYEIVDEGIIITYNEPSFAFGPIGAFFNNNTIKFVQSNISLNKKSKSALVPSPLWEELFEEDLFEEINPFVGTWIVDSLNGGYRYIFTENEIKLYDGAYRQTNDPFNPMEFGWALNRKGTYSNEDINNINIEFYTSWAIENNQPPELLTVVYNEKTKKAYVSYNYNFGTGTIMKISKSTLQPQPLFLDDF